MTSIMIVLLYLTLVSAIRANVKIENKSGGALFDFSLSSKGSGHYSPILRWPKVEKSSFSSAQPYPGTQDYLSAFTFTFNTEDGRTCYPSFVWDPYEYHGLEKTDRLVVITIEKWSQRSKLRFFISTSHVSAGELTCHPQMPFEIQVLNLSHEPIFNVSVSHENAIRPFLTSRALFWPELATHTASEPQESLHKLPGNNYFGVKFTTRDGKICQIDDSWILHRGRKMHRLEADDEILSLSIRRWGDKTFAFTISTGHNSAGRIACREKTGFLD